MAIHTFLVAESRTYIVRYTVEAATDEEARELAETGETESEEEIRCNGVTEREIVE